MQIKKHSSAVVAFIAILLVFASIRQASAQPSAAQLKALEPKTGIVSFKWHLPGKREWSSTYKKYVYSINWTAKRKTDQPGVYLTVTGYSSFDIVGGRYVYWRDFVSGNSYDGQKPPSVAEINAALQNESADSVARHMQVGEWESLRLAPNPDWEWHTMNSVSFTVVAVYRVKYSGRIYGDEPQLQKPSNKEAIDRIESYLRFRLYRDSPTSPWRSVGISDQIPGADSKYTRREVKKLLGRELVDYMASRDLPGPTRLPVLTQ